MGSICWLLLVSLVVTVVQLFDSGRCIVLFTDFFFPFFFFFYFLGIKNALQITIKI